jgi:DNA invertase Pin-like site-specific DNA recombinase
VAAAVVSYPPRRERRFGRGRDAQVAALKAAGAERVFSEKQSGAKTDRAALAALDAGDVLVVNRARAREKHP